MHRVLERQIKRFAGDANPERASSEWRSLLEAISDTYTHGDEDRVLLARSLELSSKEFANINERLRQENAIIEEKVRQRTRELEVERIKLTEITQQMTTGAILLDQAGSVEFINTAASRFLSVSDADRALDSLKSFFDKLPVAEHLEAAKKGEAREIAEAEAGGKIFLISFVPLRTVDGAFGTLVWLSDITEQRLLDRTKDQFISIASHEMRTPLAIIRGNAELLLGERTVSENKDQKEEAESIVRSALRLLDIVNDFLDVQHLESNRIALKLEPVDLVQTLKEITSDLTKLAADKGVTLQFVPPEDALVPQQLDRFRLQQICINLIANAIHYTEHGTVSVSLSRQGDAVKMIVTDTGIGIAPEDQEIIFKKFQGAGKVFLRSREYGSGLGLYISTLLAKLMKGEVKLEQSKLGEGSVFSLTLPYVI